MLFQAPLAEDVCRFCDNEVKGRYMCYIFKPAKISRALTEDGRISTTEALRQKPQQSNQFTWFYGSCTAKAKIAEDEDAEAQSYCYLTFDLPGRLQVLTMDVR